MHRLEKVIDCPRFSTKSTSSDLNVDTANRAVMIGRAPSVGDANTSDRRLPGKILESSTGHNILDFGVWMDTTFPHVVGVFGTRGMGKSFTLGVLSRLLESTMSHFHQSLRTAGRDHAELRQPHLPKRLCVVLDEAHAIAPNTERTSANSALVDYAKRGRDAGLSLVFATQQPSAVDTRRISQADLTITHRLNFDADIQAAISRMPSDASHRYTTATGRTPMPLASTIRSLAPGEAIVADSSSSRIFIQVTRPRLTAHGGNAPV